jgi:hypothetical protein
MEAGTELFLGDVVQLNPETCRNQMFAACMMTITEPKTFGAQGYVQCTGRDGMPGGQAFYRANWEEMDFVGRAPFIVKRRD